MTSLSLYFKGWLLALPVLILAAGTAAAQQPDSFRVESPLDLDDSFRVGFSLDFDSFQGESPLRSFKIQDGAVFIDGQKVSPDKLPEGFPPEGASVYYRFSTGLDKDLIVAVKGGPQYILKGDSLWATTPRAFSCTMQEHGCKDMEADAHVLFIPTTPLETILELKAEDLHEQARRLQELQGRLAESQTDELQQMVQEMTLRAAEAARMASELPHIQVQHYFSDIQDKNKGLFDRLMSERRMEGETVSMARKIAAMEEGKARRDSIAVLRERLDEIFELKQENRRREVEELEEKLQELQKAVAERERLGDQIVDRRLQELLGNDTLDW